MQRSCKRNMPNKIKKVQLHSYSLARHAAVNLPLAKATARSAANMKIFIVLFLEGLRITRTRKLCAKKILLTANHTL